MQNNILQSYPEPIMRKLKESIALISRKDRFEYPAWFRVQVIEALNSGMKLQDVAIITKVTTVTLRKWMAQCQSHATGFRELRVVENCEGKYAQRGDLTPSLKGTATLKFSSDISLCFEETSSPEFIAAVLVAMKARLS